MLLSPPAIVLGRAIGIIPPSPGTSTTEQCKLVVQMLTDRSYLRSKVPNNERLSDLGKQVLTLLCHEDARHHADFLSSLIQKYQLSTITNYDPLLEASALAREVFHNSAYAIIGMLYLQNGAKRALAFIQAHIKSLDQSTETSQF